MGPIIMKLFHIDKIGEQTIEEAKNNKNPKFFLFIK